MSLIEFTTPTVPSVAWGDDPLFRHYGTVLVGVTLYKDETDWHTLLEGYEEEVLANATKIYRGGRVYFLTQEEYDDVTGGTVEPPPDPDALLSYPGVAYPGQIYPGRTE